VLGRPLVPTVSAFTQATKDAVHGADRTQVLILLKQALVYFCRRLITIVFTVQCLDDGSTLLGTEGAWLH
jgi:hypothetical protein